MFLTVIVHWSFFFVEWSIADFVKFELQMMPMVKYGFGAWAVLGWTVITGFGFFRTKVYELWLLQHIASAGVLLWLLYVHVPFYARYNIWLSIGFVAFDRGARGLWTVAHNIRWNCLWWTREGRSGPYTGFDAEATALPHGYVHLKVHHPNFTWKPGQHIFISVPRCGVLESHPFTISTSAPASSERHGAPLSIDLYFKSHSGFTKRLLLKARSQPNQTLRARAFVSRPFGTVPLPTIERCNSVIFIASSTGASFTMPLLEHALQHGPFIQRVRFYWIVRHGAQLKWLRERLTAASIVAETLQIQFQVQLFITGLTEEMDYLSTTSDGEIKDERDLYSLADSVESEEEDEEVEQSSADHLLHVQSLSEKDHDLARPTEKEEGRIEVRTSGFSDRSSGGNTTVDAKRIAVKEKQCLQYHHSSGGSPKITTTLGRPSSWDALIYPTIIDAEGETAIIACGGRGMMSEIRNYVAQLSDERAVHKGTGAQGIYLFTETYGWSV